jgi:hypothetical protein
MQDNVVPLTHELSQLTCERQENFVAPGRQRSKSATMTPGSRIVKPSQQAFNSTGLLSKKHRILKEITPETPIKHRQMKEKYPIKQFTDTPAKRSTPVFHHTPASNLKNSNIVATPSSIKATKLHLRSPVTGSPTSLKRVHLLDLPQDNMIFKTPFTTRLIDSPTKSSRSNGEFSMILDDGISQPQSLYTSQKDPDIPSGDSSIVHSPFFETVRKDRKKKLPTVRTSPITFPSFISRHRIIINDNFFHALQGEEPFLSEFLRDCESGQSEPDYFETRFELLSRLGHGEFADAYHVLFIDDMKEYAVKKSRHPFQGFKDWYYFFNKSSEIGGG